MLDFGSGDDQEGGKVTILDSMSLCIKQMETVRNKLP